MNRPIPCPDQDLEADRRGDLCRRSGAATAEEAVNDHAAREQFDRPRLIDFEEQGID